MNSSALGRKLLVDRAAGRRQRQERFAQVGAVGAPGEEFALLELRHRARDLGLVHVGLRADRLAGHHAVLAERDQHPPLRYSDTMTAVDARERLRHQAGQHIEPVGQKFFELQQRRLGGAVPAGGALSRTGPEFIIDRAPSVERSGIGRHGGRHWLKCRACNGDRMTRDGAAQRAGPPGRSDRVVAMNAPARRYRRHSMATNSSRAEVPLVDGTAPVISSRSTLRNEPPGRSRATGNRRWPPALRSSRRSPGSGRRRSRRNCWR